MNVRPAAAGMVSIVLLATGCQYDGVTSIPLPFREGTGNDAVEVKLVLDQAQGITPNSEVKVDDVTVGSVKSIEMKGWEPVLTLTIDPDVDLPRNAVARIGQKSLLGAKFIELTPPAEDASTEPLRTGDEVVQAAAGNYPQTEQVLASLSLVLNGSGLQQVRSITDELDNVLSGRETNVRSFLTRFNDFIGSLDRQRDDIVAVVERLDRLSRVVSKDDTVATALEELPDAFMTLDQDRAELTETLEALADLGRISQQVVDETGGALERNLRNLRPALQRLADAGPNLTESLTVAGTLPFPGNTSFPRMFQGDYGNLFLTLDVSPDLLARNLLQGFQLTGDQPATVLGGPPLGSGDGPPPLTDGRTGIPQIDDLLGGLTKGLNDGLAGLTDQKPNQTSSDSQPRDNPLAALLPGLLGGGK